jgi:hypothetical protein
MAEPALPAENAGQLPTMAAGIELLRGDLAQMLPVTVLFLARTLEIASGIAVTGNWKEKSWKTALGGSVAVQLFVLSYAALCGARQTARLPSGESAEALVNGEPGAATTAVMHWLGRSAIIGIGMAAAGERDSIVPQALAGAAAIEVSVLVWALQQKAKREEAAA